MSKEAILDKRQEDILEYLDEDDFLLDDDDLDDGVSKTHKTALKAERRRQRLAELDAMKDDPELYQFMDIVPKLKPHTRGECLTRERRCIFVSCKYHLYLDVNPNTGTIKFNFPDLEPWEIPETCALDIADKGGTTLEEIGDLMNLTRERVRQLEAIVLDKIKREEDKRVLLDLDDELPRKKVAENT